MLCEKCGKNEAVFHYSEIINGKKKTLSLCQDCAPAESVFGSSILSSLFGTANVDPLYGKRRSGNDDEKKCPVCGIGLNMIAKTGKVGCAECYRTFRSELTPLIKRIHGNALYRGNASESRIEKKEISREESLRRELEKAIGEENYELAATLRDEIRAIKENNERGEG